MAKIGTAYVDVVGNFGPLEAQLAKSQSTMGQRISKLGRVAGAAVIGVGAAATKMAFDYEESLEKVTNLVGVNRHQTEEWGKQLLDLAPKVGKAPQELSEALYFVSSSGIEAAKVLNTTKIAAQASALGLGETEVVANALTSAMNAYSSSGLTARDATNVLIQAVKFGKVEADELAGSIGRVIPVASQLKVPFEDVGAALGVMSLSGLDAAEATTALRGIMNTFIKPSAEANTALKSVGLSAEEIRDRMGEKGGVIEVLRLLEDRFDGNVEAMGDVFPNIRALTGVFNLLGNEGDKVDKIFAETNASTDDLGKSWEDFNKTPAQQMRRAMAGIQAALVELGGELLPEVSELFSDFSRIVTDEHLTSDEKISGVLDLIADKASEALPVIADVGVKAAGALLKGFAEAFLNSDVLGKLFLGASLIRLLGGRGAILAAGTKAGALLGLGLGSGAAAGLAGGSTAAGAAAAGGAAGGIVGRVRTALSNVKWARIGGVGIGIALADAAFGEWDRQNQINSSEWRESLKALGGPGGIVGALGDAFEEVPLIGSDLLHESERQAQELMGTLEDVFASGRKIDLAEAMDLRKAAREAGLAGDAYEQLVDELNGITKAIPRADQVLPDLNKLLGSGKDFDLNVINDIVGEIERLPKAAQDNTAAMVVAMARELERKGELPKGATRELLGWIQQRFPELRNMSSKEIARMVQNMGLSLKDLRKIFKGEMDASANAVSRGVRTAEQELGHLANVSQKDGKKTGDNVKKPIQDAVRSAKQELGQLPGIVDREVGGAAKKGSKHSGKLKSDFVGSVNSMTGAAYHGMGNIGKNVNKALKALGLKKQVEFGLEAPSSEEVEALHRTQRGGPVARAALAIGGLAGIVPGHAFGDRHTLSVDGVPLADVESREGIFVGNRRMMENASVINDLFPRFKMQKGGGFAGLLNFALGPYDIPPIEYDPNHAGSNSHLHLSMQTVAAAMALARRIGPLGWTASESPWAGGVTVRHSDPGHYDGRAFDANAADESRGAVAQVAKILGGVGGGVGGLVDRIKREILTGPAGPMLDYAQAATDEVLHAANDYMAKQAPTIGAGEAAGALSPAQFARAARLAIAAAARVNPAARNFSVGGLQTLAMAESSLIPSSINLWDSNAAAGNPSGGLMHLTRSNFRAYHVRGTANDMFDPVASIAASIIYQLDRYGGQVTHSPYARGGPLGFVGSLLGLEEGGPLDLNQLLGNLLAAEGPGDRRDLIGKARDRFQNKTAINFLTADGELAGNLAELRGLADQYGLNADQANALLTTDADGNEIGVPYLGQFEEGWVVKQLEEGLWPLRNRLISKSDIVKGLGDTVKRLIKRLKGPKGILDQLDDEIRDIKKEIRRLEKERKDLEDELEEATESKEKSEKEIQERIDKEMRKDPKKRDNELIRTLREQLRSKSTEREAILALLGDNRRATQHNNTRLEKVTSVRDSMRDAIGGMLTTRDEELAGGLDALIGPDGELSTVQGTGIPNEFKELVEMPGLDAIGGELFDAQLRLKELRTPEEGEAPEEEEPIEDNRALAEAEEKLRLTQEKLLATQQRLLVQQSQFPVFDEFRRNTFHGGGIARARARGGEVASILKDEEGIFTPEQMAALGPGTSIVIERGAGVDPTKIKEIAADGTRRSVSVARRSIGGNR